MAIVEMLKLKLYGANVDKQKVLDSLFETKLVQLKDVEDIDNTSVFFDDKNYSNIDQKRSKLEKAIKLIEERQDQLPKSEKKEKYDPIVDVTIQEFENIVNQKGLLDLVLQQIDDLLNEQADLKKERVNLQNKINQLLPFTSIKEDLNTLKNTKYTTVLLGTIPTNANKEFDLFLQECSLTTCEYVGSEGTVLKVFSHNSESNKVIKKLNEIGFVKANFNIEGNVQTNITEAEKQIKEIDKKEQDVLNNLLNFRENLTELKIMHDYLKFCMAKEDAENKFRCTQQSFVLEAYLPKDKKEKVDKKLKQTSNSIEYEFVDLDKSEIPPTMTKNNKVVSQFEFVTNMYSAPHYRELDPNAFIALFFSIFFGFVMADIGYGICLLAFGLFMALKQKRQTGFKKLMNVIAIGGLFTIIFGVMFGSFFGVSHETWKFVPPAILPNPVDSVITLLVACLAAGAVQIMVSFVLKGILLIKRKQVAAAIFTAFAWDFFFVGLALFLLDFAGITKGLTLIGIIIAVASVAVSIIGTAIISKGFERLLICFLIF